MPVDLSFDELMANDVAVSNFLGTLRFGYTLPAVPFHYPLTVYVRVCFSPSSQNFSAQSTNSRSSVSTLTAW